MSITAGEAKEGERGKCKQCVCMLACIGRSVNMCACARTHVLTEQVGVLILKWSTHADRLALL